MCFLSFVIAMDSKLYHDVYHYLEHGDYPMDLMMEEKKVLKEKRETLERSASPLL